jgi:hypothetical protein
MLGTMNSMSRLFFENSCAAMLTGAQLIALFPGLSVSLAADAIPIGAVLANVSAHQLYDITVRGTITDIQELPPYIGRLGVVRGACRFFLKDQTGMIEIQVGQYCMPKELATAAARGQAYEVRGVVQVRGASKGSIISVVAFEIKPFGD